MWVRNGFSKLQCIPNTLRSVLLNSSFRSIPGIKMIQDWTLNAFHGQALATALKLNKTVVDINLAGNFDCGDEGAEVWWTWVQGE